MEERERRRGVIVINTRKHPKHAEIANRIKKIIECEEILTDSLANVDNIGTEMSIVDIGQGGALHEKYFQICAQAPSFVITLDLAGFEMKTDRDGYAYNTIPVRMLHFLLGTIEEYREILAGEFNFSMFFYTGEENYNRIRKEYPELLNVNKFTSAEKGDIPDGQEIGRMLADFFVRGKIG